MNGRLASCVATQEALQVQKNLRYERAQRKIDTSGMGSLLPFAA